jgi:threonine dehydrogenase-like Zn-dependent dehydrogenase
VDNAWTAREKTNESQKNVLILGTGFLATTLYVGMRDLKKYGGNKITVVGNANKAFWIKQDVNFVQTIEEISEDEKFDAVYDLTSKARYVNFTAEHISEEGIIIMASEKKPNIAMPIQELLWKSATISFPSPRSSNFIKAMSQAHDLIHYDKLDTSKLWTQEYDRDTQVMQAFNDGLHRQEGYSRGYIRW